MEHVFKEHRFYPEGIVNGVTTAVQSFICRSCDLQIELPGGVDVRDYPNEECNGGTRDENS